MSHAELAWRFVQWALTQDGSSAPTGVDATSLRDLVAEEFERAISGCEDMGSSEPAYEPDEVAMSRFGVLPERTRRELRRTALRDLIAPCAAQLLGTREPTSDQSRPAQHRPTHLDLRAG